MTDGDQHTPHSAAPVPKRISPSPRSLLELADSRAFPLSREKSGNADDLTQEELDALALGLYKPLVR